MRCSLRSTNPGSAQYLAPGLPLEIDGTYPPAVAAPALGDDTAAVLREWLQLNPDEIRQLTESGTVA